MISEISNLMVRLLLSCVIGEDLSDTKVDYWINGQLTSQDLSFALRNCFSQTVNRLAAPHVCLIPLLADFYITPHERDLKANCQNIRELVRGVIKRRMLSDLAGKHDLLSIMLENSLFQSDIEITVDELLTVFFAGSQTSANVTQNLILNLCKHPEYKRKVLDEIDKISLSES